MQNLQQMKMMGMVPMLQDPMMQQQYEMSAYNQFREQALKALKQQEITQMNEVEKEISQLDSEIEKNEADLENIQNEVHRFAITFLEIHIQKN